MVGAEKAVGCVENAFGIRHGGLQHLLALISLEVIFAHGKLHVVAAKALFAQSLCDAFGEHVELCANFAVVF